MRAACLVLLLFLCPLSTRAEAPPRPPRGAAAPEDGRASDSLAAEYRRRVDLLTSPELEKRKSDRRRVQRRGYAAVLAGVVRRDGLGALLAYARLRLQLEYSLPHDVLIAYYPVLRRESLQDSLPGFTTFGSGLYGVPLREDRSFPRDPWENP
jgi:hypothetical protein